MKSAQLEREDLHQYMAEMFVRGTYRKDVCNYAHQIAIDRQQYIEEFNSETKMKPFDLERALAGDKVVTRDGREVTQVTKFDIEKPACVYGVINGHIHTFNEIGRYNNVESLNDLFMAPKVVKYKRWVVLYPCGEFGDHESELDAMDEVIKNDHRAEARLIEWEVEE
jgi:hypothetical protein